MTENTPAIGIIGGSGLYQMEGVENPTEHRIGTPFGEPSDAIMGGRMHGRDVYFLPRHGRGHRLLPHELNHRANIYALRSLNVRWIICVTAVGSLQERYAPRHIVLPSQFFDRTSRRAEHSFFGEGIAAHVGFSDPVSTNLRKILAESATAIGATVHNGGTYVNMDGPAFSTRAESEFNRRQGFDVIGMTNVAEA
ncbi:MAG TPA: MTAP family purine nucleoside phosphorylase, partial [Chthoniobacterales bacterium]